jgi:hypothetical protein
MTLNRTVMILVFALTLSINGLVAAQGLHKWEAISYPDLPTPFASGFVATSIRPTENGLTLSLSFSWANDDAEKDGFVPPDGKKIGLALHDAAGNKAEPIESNFDRELIAWGRRGYSSGSFQCTFPWSENEMSEGWLEIRMPNESFWLEIPYGFTRDPSADTLPVSRNGSPKLPPALEQFPNNTRLVNWKHVVYDIGKIQNRWQLILLHSNSFDASSEILLYRDDRKIGKSMFLWDLHSPRTKLSIKHANGFTLPSRAMSLRLHDDGMRRSDTFEFSRNPGNDDFRDWGTITIEVDDKQWVATLPSSMFRYVHGVADPYHQSTIR